MRPRVFHLDTGGCGACAVELWAAVESSPELQWAAGPDQADVVALTGSLTPATRAAALALYQDHWAGRVPVIAVGRCAVDGYPYGRGGVVAAGIEIQGKVEACPPLPTIILYGLLNAVPESDEGRR